MEQPSEIRFRGIASPVPPKDEVRNASSSNVVVSADGITVRVEDPTHKLQWWEILEKAFVQLTTTEENRTLYGIQIEAQHSNKRGVRSSLSLECFKFVSWRVVDQ